MKKSGLFLFIFLIGNFLYAQENSIFKINFELKNNSKLTNKNIKLETFKFYVSNLRFYNKGKSVFEPSNYYKLIDLSEDSLFRIDVEIPITLNIDEIQFDIGIDSNTNKLGVQSGELDPMQGMYWSWQSGYINFKIEGTSPICNTRKNKFHFHIGGFNPGQYAIQNLTLRTNDNRTINIEINLNTFFESIDLEKEPSIMIPGKRAIEISKIYKGMFSTKSN